MFEMHRHNCFRPEAIISQNMEYFGKKNNSLILSSADYSRTPAQSEALCEHLLWLGFLIILLPSQQKKVITIPAVN